MDGLTLDDMRLIQGLEEMRDRLTNFGRGYQCYLESCITPGRARLPRRLKKATKKFMAIHGIRSMVIKPQNRFVCYDSKGHLIVCHTKY